MHWYRTNLGTNFPILNEHTTSAFVNVLQDINSPEHKAIENYDQFSLVHIGLDVHGVYLQTQANSIECAQERFVEIILQVINSLNISEINNEAIEHAVVEQGIIRQGRGTIE